MIRESHHMVVITGAGISTDAGIPDFVGPTVCWQISPRQPFWFSVAKHLFQACGHWKSAARNRRSTLDSNKQHPPSHIEHCVTRRESLSAFCHHQNIDGLHHRSGLPLEKLAELHGNVFSEECEVCHTQVCSLNLLLIECLMTCVCNLDHPPYMRGFVLSETNG